VVVDVLLVLVELVGAVLVVRVDVPDSVVGCVVGAVDVVEPVVVVTSPDVVPPAGSLVVPALVGECVVAGPDVDGVVRVGVASDRSLCRLWPLCRESWPLPEPLPVFPLWRRASQDVRPPAKAVPVPASTRHPAATAAVISRRRRGPGALCAGMRAASASD
jgi:hypothetical protein